MSKAPIDVAATVESLVAQTQQLQAEVRQRPLKWTTQIYDLGDDDYMLYQPLMVLIEEYTDEMNVIARLPELEVFGEGSTISEAVWALKNAILDLYDELTAENPALLGDLPLAWLRILKRIITKNLNYNDEMA
jgi:hypothetical protein